MKKLIVSTGNQAKLREIKEILKDFPLEVLSKNQAGFAVIEVVEDGNSLYENAFKKAQALKEEAKSSMVLADDSGLFVRALDWGPGIHSSRFGGQGYSDEDKVDLILKEMEGIEDRYAEFRAVLVLIDKEEVIEIQGIVRGQISFEKMGVGGFGYDPIFIPEGYQKSFGQLEPSIKNQISHRAQALEKLKKVLEERI